MDKLAAESPWATFRFPSRSQQRPTILQAPPCSSALEPRIKKAVDKYALRYVQLIKQASRAGIYRRSLDPYTAMSLMMGGMCHLTAVWLLYGRKYDLVKKGKALFTTLRNGFVQR